MNIQEYYNNKYTNLYNNILNKLHHFILPINSQKNLADLYDFLYEFKDDIHNIDMHFDNYCKLLRKTNILYKINLK